jgi:hypothetical protein
VIATGGSPGQPILPGVGPGASLPGGKVVGAALAVAATGLLRGPSPAATMLRWLGAILLLFVGGPLAIWAGRRRKRRQQQLAVDGPGQEAGK